MQNARVIQEATIEATVIRCGCGNPDSHAGEVCPQGIPTNLGVVSYYNHRWYKRLMWRVKQEIAKWQQS
jgi:ABC-type antimicrobial peptide transport system ATPase subunit